MKKNNNKVESDFFKAIKEKSDKQNSNKVETSPHMYVDNQNKCEWTK